MDLSYHLSFGNLPVGGIRSQPDRPTPSTSEQAELLWATFVARPEVERDCWQAVIWQGACICALVRARGLTAPVIEQHLLRMAMALDDTQTGFALPGRDPASVESSAQRRVAKLHNALRHRRARCPACAAQARRSQH